MRICEAGFDNGWASRILVLLRSTDWALLAESPPGNRFFMNRLRSCRYLPLASRNRVESCRVRYLVLEKPIKGCVQSQRAVRGCCSTGGSIRKQRLLVNCTAHTTRLMLKCIKYKVRQVLYLVT